MPKSIESQEPERQQITTTLEEIEALLDNANKEECIFFGGKSMIVFYELPDRAGFTISGEAGTVDKESFDPVVGRAICRQNAIKKLRLLEGYRLQILKELEIFA